ncbi:MAG: ABC transporter substrate-binding protein, partial [Candidatus Poribacteria bacterium]|nr:ABC transporter substrate-binding protein [Candidatus Poribacteria bacterium]
DGVAAIIGPNFSRHAVRIAPIAQNHGIPMITTSATNPTITDAGDFVFMAAFTDDFQGKVMAQFADRELRASTAAVLTQEGDVFSEGLSQTFIDNFTGFGGNVVAHEFYTSGDTDFTVQLTAIAQFAPDVIFMPGFVPDVPLAIKQARTIPQPNATGITATFLGADSWDDPELLSMGSQAVEGSFFSSAFSAAPPTSGQTGATLNESARQFISAYQSMFGRSPDGPGALGYDALKLVVQAMRRADQLEPAAIRDQIAATRGYTGATTLIGYNSNRHATKSAVILRIQGGQVQFHQQIEP